MMIVLQEETKVVTLTETKKIQRWTTRRHFLLPKMRSECREYEHCHPELMMLRELECQSRRQSSSVNHDLVFKAN